MDIFANPKFLWFLLYAFLLSFAVIWFIPKKRLKYLKELIASPDLRRTLTQAGPGDQRNLKALLLALAYFMIALALAGPQWGLKTQQAPALNSNVIICLDVSDSMLAQDVKPSRFERSKLEIIQAFARSNTQTPFRAGLVTFAGKAYLQCPLTLDTSALKFILETLTPGMLPYAGTNIAGGLKTASSILSQAAGTRNILVITDGEDHGGNARSMIPELKKNKIRVWALWAGSPMGEPIPLKDETGNFLGYKKDKGGETVLSRAQGSTLEEIARATGGKFLRLDNDANPQAELMAIAQGSDPQKGKAVQVELENRFQAPLAIGFLLLLVEFVLPEKRRRAKTNES